MVPFISFWSDLDGQQIRRAHLPDAITRACDSARSLIPALEYALCHWLLSDFQCFDGFRIQGKLSSSNYFQASLDAAVFDFNYVVRVLIESSQSVG